MSQSVEVKKHKEAVAAAASGLAREAGQAKADRLADTAKYLADPAAYRAAEKAKAAADAAQAKLNEQKNAAAAKAAAAQAAKDKAAKDKAAAAKAAADKAAKAKAAADAAKKKAAALAAQRADDEKAAQAISNAVANTSTGAAVPETLYESVSASSTTATSPVVTTPDVKIATSNLFIFEDIALTAETMTDLVFEDIGGRELIDIVSGDMVYDLATQAAPNQPIKNLSAIVERYSPKNLINLQGTSDKFFQSNFQIDINSYIPMGSDVVDRPHVYMVTPENSNDVANEQLLDHLVIEVVNVNVANNERVEVQILSYNDVYDDTIY